MDNYDNLSLDYLSTYFTDLYFNKFYMDADRRSKVATSTNKNVVNIYRQILDDCKTTFNERDYPKIKNNIYKYFYDAKPMPQEEFEKTLLNYFSIRDKIIMDDDTKRNNALCIIFIKLIKLLSDKCSSVAENIVNDRTEIYIQEFREKCIVDIIHSYSKDIESRKLSIINTGDIGPQVSFSVLDDTRMKFAKEKLEFLKLLKEKDAEIEGLRKKISDITKYNERVLTVATNMKNAYLDLKKKTSQQKISEIAVANVAKVADILADNAEPDIVEDDNYDDEDELENNIQDMMSRKEYI